jgi:phosphate transport system substrate-binding protein
MIAAPKNMRVSGAFVLGAALGVWSSPASAQLSGTVKVDGSSTVAPIMMAAAEMYQAKEPKVRVTVGISGTGGGFKKFARGEIDISDASRPILAKEIEECKKNGIEFIELPIAFDALTVMVNPNNSWVDHLTVAELKKMWEPGAQGKVTNWNQIRPGFPDAPLKLYGAGSDSGTFDYFTEAIVGKAKSSRGDYAGSEDDKDKLKAVPIIAAPGAKAVGPSPETVIDGSYQPLSRPIFIYVNKKSLERAEVKEFVEFYLSHGETLARDVKYVPLPSVAYKKGLERLAGQKTGTIFGGIAEVGVTADLLFTRELKN